MKDALYIDFHEVSSLLESRRTKQWWVLTKDCGDHLGVVRWWSPWRCYIFLPYADTIYEQRCLRDLAAFCDEQTQEQRKTWKKRAPR